VIVSTVSIRRSEAKDDTVTHGGLIDAYGSVHVEQRWLGVVSSSMGYGKLDLSLGPREALRCITITIRDDSVAIRENSLLIRMHRASIRAYCLYTLGLVVCRDGK
jgi:hypothetical protein